MSIIVFYYRKRPPNKSKKSPVGSWRSFFNLGKSSSMSKRKLHRNPSEPNELKAMALAGECSHRICSKNCLELISVVQQQELNKIHQSDSSEC